MAETIVVNISRGEKCDVVIDRRTRWGNQYKISHAVTREEAIRLHMIDLLGNLFSEDVRRELTGKRLGCHCTPKDCHGNNYKAVCDGPEAIRDRCAAIGLQV